MTGPAIVPGDVDQSLLIRRVLGLDGEDRMPLDKDPLSSEQIERLRDWIAGGAPWPDDSIPQTAPHGTAHIASKPTAPMIALATCLSMAGSDIAGA